MRDSNTNSKLNTQVYDEACEWLVHFRAGDADHDVEARRQLDEWLRRSPEHVRAYLEVSTLWEDMAEHDSKREVSAQAHIARALAERNVFALETEGTKRARSSTPGERKRAWRNVAWAATVAAIAIAASVAWWQVRLPVYATDIGEQRSIALDDGSRLELNARSRVRVRYTERERAIELFEGQALFRVAKDPTRPFVVASDSTRIRAVGTQFDVNRRNGGTIVTVVEGKVNVHSSPNPAEEVPLVAGEQLTVNRTVTVPRRTDVAAATAWTQHQLVFNSVPLSEVAEEFNRYNKRPIVIRDKALERFGIVGVFSSTDPSSLLTFLRAQPEIEVSEGDSEIRIDRK